jgi:hypothetical protein
MRIMAENAGLLHRRMQGLFCFQPLFLVGMAREAKGVALLHKPVGKIALMVVMTAGTVPGGNRRMQDLVLDDTVRMTLKAEFGHCLFQHGLVRRLVRIMTGHTVPAHDRSMDDPFFVIRLVAHKTEVRTLLNQGESEVPRVLSGFFGQLNLVACRAHTLFDRIVDGLFPAHARMAFGCNA